MIDFQPYYVREILKATKITHLYVKLPSIITIYCFDSEYQAWIANVINNIIQNTIWNLAYILDFSLSLSRLCLPCIQARFVVLEEGPSLQSLNDMLILIHWYRIPNILSNLISLSHCVLYSIEIKHRIMCLWCLYHMYKDFLQIRGQTENIYNTTAAFLILNTHTHRDRMHETWCGPLGHWQYSLCKGHLE